MNVAFIDMIGGASGNMLLGALADAGADLAAIEGALHTLPIDGWSIERSTVLKRGITAQYVQVHVAGEDGAPGDAISERRLRDMLDILERSELSTPQKERAGRIFLALANAEARVHGTTPDQIHFHEVGQIDAIVDVVATVVALDLLDIGEVYCSAYPLGRGMIRMRHGLYPNPPPATASLMLGAPTTATDVEGEMVTTTAAAILSTLVASPGVRPSMRFDRIGYGAGRADFSVPNVTRIIIGAKTTPSPPEGLTDEVVLLETNIDDMSPQHFELAIERLFAAGAIDVWTTPIMMKKQRPATLLCALVAKEHAQSCAAVILRETTSLGVRSTAQTRSILRRTIAVRQTSLGEVRVKTAVGDGYIRHSLEYDDLVHIARTSGRTLADIEHEIERTLDRELP